MKSYEIVSRSRKGEKQVAIQEAKSGNAALRKYGCNVPKGGKSTYTTKKGRKLRARPL